MISKPMVEAALAEMMRLLAADDLGPERRGDESPEEFVARKTLEAALQADPERARLVEENERLRRELQERRACLVGAKETAEMVRDTLTNASALELTKTSLYVPVRERIELLQQAIDNTDAALSAQPSPLPEEGGE